MKKIRINELARELEVKAHEILERLPELGVAEKKTHSSSIDEDVAIRLRRLYGKESPVNGDGAGDDSSAIAVEDEPETVEAEEVETAPPGEDRVPAPETSAGEADRPAASEAGRLAHAAPIRPPLASGRAVHPPVSIPASRTPQTPAPPTFHTPPTVPQTPHPAAPMPPVAMIAPGRPSAPAAKPIPVPAGPGPRPGQILSGPRTPLPSIPGETPRPPAGSPVPGAPRPPLPPRPRLEAFRPAGGGPPAAQTTPQGGRPLAGQPAARPIVPPRADLVAKLTAPRPFMPAQPAAPRPGVPKPPSSPVPGQPIYRGPIRPGQPLVVARQGPGPAGARPSGPPMRPGPRPQHPTSARPGMGPGLAPPPMDQPRPRLGDKRPGRGQQRERVEEEKVLRPQVRRHVETGPPPINREITISEGITVKELCEKLDVKATLVMKKLMDRGIFATINQTLDSKLATEVARDFGASTATVSYETEAMQAVEDAEEAKDLHTRAPVVTIMGHVDHGKTSLLDGIREANVAAREAGGITQHIGAYHVEMNGRKIVFIDTPGHEAFTRMRARGAKVTDIVVLVVAADDGVMPQTLEAIDHARAAGVPIVVAINKIDKPGAQPERIKQQLADRGLLAEDWGGDVVMVPVSAKTHENVDRLLEMILLVADMQELKANPSRPAIGTVLEAQLDRGRGPVATVLVRNGTLSRGRFLHLRRRLRQGARHDGRPRRADPQSRPRYPGRGARPGIACPKWATISRWSPIPPRPSRSFNFRDQKVRDAALAKSGRLTLEQFHKQMREGEVKELPVIIKTDVGGSAEVLAETLKALEREGDDQASSVPALAPSTKATSCWPPLPTPSSSVSTCARSAMPRPRRAGKSGYPPAHHHLQPHRRDQARHDRAA
jgi:translation initiation factor IF-2